jgi:hypothetical protein
MNPYFLPQAVDSLACGYPKNLLLSGCEFKKNKYLCNSKIGIDFIKTKNRDVFNNGKEEGNLQNLWQIRG